MRQIRQGDILLVAVDQPMPPNLSPSSTLILAEGEATGHHHVLTAPQVYEWEVDGQRYVRVNGGVGSIAHADHDPIPAPVVAPETTYRVVPQREWDLSGQWRKIAD